MGVSENLKRGVTEIVLLALLSQQDMYGYEMIETLRARSQNVFELKAGTLYPLLHSLEQKKLLTVYEKEVGGKVRKYYRITKEGHRVLKEKRQEWETYSEAVANVLNIRQQIQHGGDNLSADIFFDSLGGMA